MFCQSVCYNMCITMAKGNNSQRKEVKKQKKK